MASPAVITGTDYLEYWLWRCRREQMDLSVHPLRRYNQNAEEYEENSTMIRE